MMQQTTSLDPKKYFDEVLVCMPRMLSLQNHNPISSTYGCFHRGFWLHRIFDFPSSIYQMSCQTLAHLYHYQDDANIYYQNPNILKWAIQGFKYALTLQKSDGSFDEWYPNERGWAGPTGYLMHSLCKTYQLLEKDLPAELKEDFLTKATKSAYHLINHEESDILANHYGIALLPIYEIYLLTKDEKILQGFNKCFESFKKYWRPDEGWFLEYDGADIGYLAATISFLARLHEISKLTEIETMVEKALKFTSYFCYPNGSFAGAMGCRQTAMYYPYGFEYWSQQFPLAKRMADWGLEHLALEKMITPNHQGDHYLNYRIQEYLEAHELRKLDSSANNSTPLPYEQQNDFTKVFPDAGILIKKTDHRYLTINAKKGGVIKLFDLKTTKPLLMDSGWLAINSKNEKQTTQWIDPSFQISISEDEVEINGIANKYVDKFFTPSKWILFRSFMLIVGWNAGLAKFAKKLIRSLLVVGVRRTSTKFIRTITLNRKVTVKDVITPIKNEKLTRLYYGAEYFVRYVPQSNYFNINDLETCGETLEGDKLNKAFKDGSYTIFREF